MRALLTRKVDVAWLLLAVALSGAALVLWLSVQSGSTPRGSVYIVRAAATSVAGRGGAPAGESVVGVLGTPQRVEATQTPEVGGTTSPAAPETNPTVSALPSASSTRPEAATGLPATPAEPEVTQPAGVVEGYEPDGLVNINTASAEELDALPGIGPVLAKRIVEDREANGPFATIDDLDRVKGIGPATVSKLRDRATTGP